MDLDRYLLTVLVDGTLAMFCQAPECRYDQLLPTTMATLEDLLTVAGRHEQERHGQRPGTITVEYVGPVVSREVAEYAVGTPEQQERTSAIVAAMARATDAALGSVGLQRRPPVDPYQRSADRP